MRTLNLRNLYETTLVVEINYLCNDSMALTFMQSTTNIEWDAICRDTIFNDPRMTLGSYVKGPNNMICREWVWKGLPLGAGFRFGPGFMSDHTKMGLDCIAKLCIIVVWKVWLLEFSPRSITFSPFLLPFSSFFLWGPSPLSFFLLLFSLLY